MSHRVEFDGWAWWRCRIERTTNRRGRERWVAHMDRRFTSWERRYGRRFRTREAAEHWGNGKLDAVAGTFAGEVIPDA